MVENPITYDVGTNSVDSFLKSVQYITIEDLINSASNWNEPLMEHHQLSAIEKADEHGFHFGLGHASFFRFWWAWRQLLLALALRLRVILKEPTFITSNDSIDYYRIAFNLLHTFLLFHFYDEQQISTSIQHNIGRELMIAAELQIHTEKSKIIFNMLIDLRKWESKTFYH